MELVFDVVKNGKNIPQKRNFHFDENGGLIGRNDHCNWVLSDPNSYISGEHARILCKHGTYFITDESTNGTYLKNPYKKLPKGNPVKINASDVFIIGDHELQARFSNNDYTQDDIISSFKTSASVDNIIPNDDFLFESDSSSFLSVNDQAPSDLDVLSTLEVFREPAPIFAPSSMKIPLEDNAIMNNDFDLNFGMDLREDNAFIDTEVSLSNEIMQEHISMPRYEEAKSQMPKTKVPVSNASGLAASISILEQKLGIEINSLAQEERDLLMQELGDIFNTTLDALKNSLLLKDKTKQDLHLSSSYMDADSNNPIRLGSAASKLLQSKESSRGLGMMSISDAMLKSFNELDSHCIALHSSTKNLFTIATSKFAPKNLEYRFEVAGSLRGVLPRQQLMWKAYCEMFDSLNERPEEGIEIIRDDFTKEYENISYSLKLHSNQRQQRI